ncbi:hypothetical protein BHE74_00008126 [Ensete ventricosum]|nr:hypothetical protein GW17_00024602 [Ensete ventricosum]RWW83363.1 hypothetical protein BHE74_00008126 [Ensete ventricosum]
MMQWELVRSSQGVCRRNQETHWEHAERSSEEDRKTHHKNAGGYQIGGTIVPSVSDGCTVVAQESGQQATVILPRPMVVPLIPYFHGAFGGGIVGTDGCTARTRFFRMHLNFGSILLKLNGVY